MFTFKKKPKSPTEHKRENSVSVGTNAEQRALDYLQSQGLKLVQQNYRCRMGEIDLIMRDKNTLVFIEVRFRKPSQYASALESITPAKQHKIRLTAEHYLQTTSIKRAPPCRFDAVGVDGSKVNWVQSAFY